MGSLVMTAPEIGAKFITISSVASAKGHDASPDHVAAPA